MPIPKSGWGLTPGALEANATRALGGKYGSAGNLPGSLSEMTRQKYSSGLDAKRAKEQLDLSKTMEANRQAESARGFGLDTEKFGFAKSEADRAYELQKLLADRGFGLDTQKLALDELTGERSYGLGQRGADLSDLNSQRAMEESLRNYELQKQGLGQGANQWAQQLGLSQQQLASSEEEQKRKDLMAMIDLLNSMGMMGSGSEIDALRKSLGTSGTSRPVPIPTSPAPAPAPVYVPPTEWHDPYAGRGGGL